MDELTRRDALRFIVAAGAAATTSCSEPSARLNANGAEPNQAQGPDPIVGVTPLSTPWQTSDPFLFCVHHDDAYPAGNEQFGPAASLEGRELGMDFAGKDGWRMYHGEVVPGFPRHPHRGFETVTVVRRGLLDHSDSMGAMARYGRGDVQWLTAGSGIQHAEMFPLLRRESPNPVELFQIWLNLPRANKMVEPYFSMLWQPLIVTAKVPDRAGFVTEVTVIAGRYRETSAPPPPPNSWAAHSENDVAIWTIKMPPGARWSLPKAGAESSRSLYFFRGSRLRVGQRDIPPGHRVELRPEHEVLLEAGPSETEVLLLQGRRIGEPLARRGPFVMNSEQEIRQAYLDYQRTQFGGWRWGRSDPVHGPEEARFARRADGSIERPS